MQKKVNKPKLYKLEKFNEKKIRKLLNKETKETLIDLLVNFEFNRIGVLNSNRQTMNNIKLRQYNMEDLLI
tara:strand:+ start:798 stop:1010 length:213 start_codon:yes stop_codon:yes gene_type:complete